MNLIGVIIIATVISSSKCVSEPSSEDEAKSRPRRLLGGSVTSISQYPFLVSLSYNGIFICGGSIITEIIILTAAHCIIELDYRGIIVRAGSTKHNYGGTEHRIFKMIPHEEYYGSSSTVASNDIALLKLANFIKFSKYANPVKLYEWPGTTIEGSTAISIGWGRIEEYGYSASERLRSIPLRILSKNDCANAYQNQVNQWAYDQICAYLPGRGHCKGDSGGPLIVKNLLAGIVSWDTHCGTQGLPGVYTEVAVHRQWIERNIHYLYNELSYG
ncbi:hypothetical protein QAD02_009069 [Eretmocerus hayati]|uniref:Uncharacterized protein n=1 Tax=Eretmocerus hayati TaxID=131215 RepID=A0ACC2N9P4_9HYME|nr:hypothetical protein QAD02_009069 [Eretmocerus hayati]